MVRVLLCLALVLVTACQRQGGAGEAQEAEIGPVEIGPAMQLDVALAMLRAQLDTAAAGLDEAGARSLGRVETISDRLLETRLPFAWISAESYSLEARLRQIQARADRVEALWTGGGRRDDVLAGIMELRAEVERLQDEVAAGGTPAPAPIGALLDSLDRLGPGNAGG